MANAISFAGLFLTLVGATLLFFYGLPRKKLGNVIISGETAMKHVPDPGERDVPEVSGSRSQLPSRRERRSSMRQASRWSQ
jgi:hypothetical protein